MIEYTSKCTGCTACESICKFKAIKMEENANGFKYPNVNKEICVNCKECERVCPLNKKSDTKKFKSEVYACYCKDKNTRVKSSSGGVFSVIANKILDDNGVVYGASFDEEYNVKHIKIDECDEIEKLRGSKYVQSSLDGIFKDVEKNLKDGRKVLFTGTPCQVEGILHFLKNKYENLYTIDFICHGVPSPKVWKKYIEFRKKEDKQDKIINISFREKSELGWDKYAMNIKYSNNEEYKKIHSEDLYMKAFLGDVSLRESCYQCDFKGKERKSDITLADFWGVKNVMPSMYGKEGTSVLMINGEKGKILFDNIKNDIDYKKTNINDVIKYNQSMIKSVNKPESRNNFFKNIDIDEFDKLVKDNVKEKNSSLICRIKKLVKEILIRWNVLEEEK